jgi:nitroimidazol reductase NimA-like FMN-containing flavoprotein (pyridoxamine 5'-phosphate oxidase superfamily)
MAVTEPVAEKLSSPSGTPLTVLSWTDARTRLSDSEDYLLATSSASGRVHTVPALAVWLDGAVCFVTRRQTRKARYLAENDKCAITVPGHDIDLVVEGTARLVRDLSGCNMWPTCSRSSIRGEGGFHGVTEMAKHS